MKSSKLLWCALFTVTALSWGAQAGIIETTVNQPIPDGDPSGLASTINLSGLTTPVGNLQVDLNISGTWNGDLYAYLTHGSGFVVLLNRVGTTANNDLGYGDHGLNLVFANNAPDIHNYQTALAASSGLPLNGPLSGTWGPDGRAVSPLSVTDTDSRTTSLSSFQGLDPNGQWTLFVADVNGGDVHQLNSWSLELNGPATVVPDAGATAALLLAAIGLIGLIARLASEAGSSFRAQERATGKASGPTGSKPTHPGRGGRTLLGKSFQSLMALALAMGWAAPVSAETGGSVTGWGISQIFPLAGYGATFTAVSAGRNHNLALTMEGTVVPWGSNGRGECNVPSGLSRAIGVAAGGDHSVAALEDGTVAAWGWNDAGQCDVPIGLGGVAAVAAGAKSSVALLKDGTVVSWGDLTVPAGLNGVTAITWALALKSDGTVVSFYSSPLPPGLDNVTAIAADSLALKADGTVVDLYGQPVPVGLNNVIGIAAGTRHRLALKADGTVVAWGDNSYGQCNVPNGLVNVQAVAADDDHSLALLGDGTVVGWGNDDYGGATSPNGLKGMIAIAGGRLALAADGTIRSFGATPDPGLPFTPEPEGLRAVAVAVGAPFIQNFALKADGTVIYWGQTNYFPGPPPAGLNGVTAIAAGWEHSLALKADGTVVMWGGVGVAWQWIGPLQVPPGLNEVVAISAGGGPSDQHSRGPGPHDLALKIDGTVVGWGDPAGGASPPSGLSSVVAIAAGAYHSLALKADGSVVAWGDNTQGQCDVPSSLSGVIAIAAGWYHSLALKQDGTVVEWGFVAAPVPTGLTGVVAIADDLALFGTVNHAPTAATYQSATSVNTPKNLSLFKLHNACSDPDWDTFIITAVSPNTAAGGTAQINGASIVYTPPKDFIGNDSFIYTVRDSRGASAQGMVNVTVSAPTGNGPNIVDVTVASGGAVTIHGAGIPAITYQLQASTDLLHWTILGRITAEPNGLFEFVDSQAGSYTSRYYRTVSTAE
jgi:alpha-tubulin suppressor-like RCC1 family protein/subtilisin-like proprotein convertase family protein